MLFLVLGILCTALFIAAISVYIFHDVDQDKIGHWTEAFAGLCVESVLFTLIVGGPVWLLTLLGRHLFHLRDYSPRAMLGLFLGIGVTSMGIRRKKVSSKTRRVGALSLFGRRNRPLHRCSSPR
jgi:hypothetical protein